MNFVVPVIGDAHFKNDARRPDRLASVDQIFQECVSLPVGLWAIPGDLYDATSDIVSRNDWADRIQRMANVAPVVVCFGNHDRDGDLHILAKIGAQWPVVVIDRPTVIEVLTPQGVTMAVFVLPYPYPSGLVADGTPVGDVVETARGLLDVILMDAGARLIAAHQRGLPTLTIGHSNVSGSKMSTGQPLVGREIELDEQMLLRLGDCPKVFNHIHYPQSIGGAILTGSVTSMSFGETEPKRYVRLDFRAPFGSDGFRWEWKAVSCPLKTPSLVLVEATFADMTFTYDIQPSDVRRGSDVRVRVRFQETERQFFEFGKVQVEDAFAHARRLQIEPICLADKGLRSPEVAAAKTLPEKLLAWCAANGEDPPAHLADAVGDLETKPADLVISEFRSRMSSLLKEE